ncbi:hypothetical protein [Comamonas sp. JUb58]|uniref:hypothetical protein n=1 Tax=Comamonas sp. JUb58 TaxID=2485114 RepID=UPI00105CD7BE|nr:hypothetical protein [Comamonas sp. JUb58]
MTKNQYRMLVLSGIAVAIVAGLVDIVFGLIPRELYMQLYMRDLDADHVLMLIASIVLLPMFVAGLYGTLRFRRWAPKFNIIFAILILLFLVADGAPWAQSGVSRALDFLASYMHALALMLPFLHRDVKRMFWPTED